MSPVSHVTKNIIRNFTPVWFAVTMGTGSVSILFHSFPYGGETQPMKIFSLLFFFLNLILFILFTILTLSRYFRYPHIWMLMIRHPTSLYLGCLPMGATTLIDVSVNLINAESEYNFGGKPFLYFIWIIWWIDVVISAVCCWGMVHYMVTTQKHSMETMTSAWLLPVVTLTVAASSGGVLAQALQKYSLQHALISATTAVFLVIVGLSLALMILTIYLLRLIVYGLPPSASALSVFLPLGPTAQSGRAVLLIGQNFKSLLPFAHSNSDFLNSDTAGETINVVCICISFLLWSLATMWIGFALLGVQSALRRSPLPFKMPFWGLVFPNGVYANLTLSLAITFDSRFFRVFGAIYAVITLVLWIYVTTRTLSLVHNGVIFEAPDLEDSSKDRNDVEEKEGRHDASRATTLAQFD